jgi:very-short-patch-repair endonuclease
MPATDPLPDREPYVDGRSDRRCQPRDPDRAIGALAARQHGTVGRAQLLGLGVTPGEIELRVKRRRLIPLFPGVYAVGHTALTQRGRWMAAVLAGGSGAVLSHRAAAGLHGLLSTAAVDVTVRTQRRSRKGVRFHQAVIPPDERTVVDGIPVTTAARTILDLAAGAPEHRVEKAIHEAEVQRLGDVVSLDDLLTRYPGRRGSAKVRSVLARGRIGLDVTKSELEDAFLRAVDDHGLRRPRRNHVVEGCTVDCAWPEHRVVVELDGRGVHDTARLFESDRARDRRLIRAGWIVVRVTWRMLVEDPAGVLDDLAALLRRRARGR